MQIQLLNTTIRQLLNTIISGFLDFLLLMEPCSSKERTNEVYALDYNREHKVVMSGGGDNSIAFYLLQGHELIINEVVEGLDDSVIFVSFIGNNPLNGFNGSAVLNGSAALNNSNTSTANAVAVTIDGAVIYIALNLKEKEAVKSVQVIQTSTDASAVAVDSKKEYVYIGGVSGAIHRMPSTLVPTNNNISTNNVSPEEPTIDTYFGHKSSIVYVVAVRNILFSVSKSQVLVHEIETRKLLSRYEIGEDQEIVSAQVNPEGKSLALGLISGGLILLSLSGSWELQEVYRREAAGNERSNSATPIEAIAYLDEYLVYAPGDKLVRVDIGDKSLRMGNIPLDPPFCVVKILPISSAFCVVVTNRGSIYLVDLRSGAKVLNEYHTDSLALDALIAGRTLLVATVNGLESIDLSG